MTVPRGNAIVKTAAKANNTEYTIMVTKKCARIRDKLKYIQAMTTHI